MHIFNNILIPYPTLVMITHLLYTTALVKRAHMWLSK
jgi:hypothetical protein